MTKSPGQQASNYAIEITAPVGRLVANLWWVIGSFVLFTGGFAVAAFVVTPVYRSATVLMPASTGRTNLGSLNSALGQLGGLASLVGMSVGGEDSETEEALAVLRSRQFTEAFIADLDLMPKLFADKWDVAQKKWKVPVKRQPTPAQAYRLFSREICTIIEDKKTGLVTLQIDWRDRNEAAGWSNELVRRINAEMRARAIAQADASVGYLQNELINTADVGTREAINRLTESQVRKRMLASVTQEYAFRVVDRAMAPDVSDPVRPAKMMLILVGLILGIGIGCMAALTVAPSHRRVRSSP